MAPLPVAIPIPASDLSRAGSIHSIRGDLPFTFQISEETSLEEWLSFLWSKENLPLLPQC